MQRHRVIPKSQVAAYRCWKWANDEGKDDAPSAPFQHQEKDERTRHIVRIAETIVGFSRGVSCIFVCGTAHDKHTTNIRNAKARKQPEQRTQKTNTKDEHDVKHQMTPRHRHSYNTASANP